MDKDWVTRHSGTIGHSVAWALGVLGTGSPIHSGAWHSVALSHAALKLNNWLWEHVLGSCVHVHALTKLKTCMKQVEFAEALSTFLRSERGV